MKYIKSFVKTQYEIDTRNCKCGSYNVEYEIKDIIREQGVSERCIVKTIISQQLISVYCPNCGMIFDFKELSI